MTPILGIMAGSGKRDTWMALYNGFASTTGDGIAIDSSNNIYSSGRTLATNFKGYITKANTLGANQFARLLESSGVDVTYYDIASDSSGNMYLAGVASTYSIVAKYNSSGVLQWQRKMTLTTSSAYYSVAVDSSGNVYCAGLYTVSGQIYDNTFLVKYNTSGTLQWHKTMTYADYTEMYYNAVDSSGNIYCMGWGQQGTIPKALFLKFNSSGTLQWQKEITDASNIQNGNGTVDSSGNVYITFNGIGGASGLMTAKYDTSGTLQWQRKFVPPSGAFYHKNSVIDSVGNVYLIGNTNAATGIIYKYDSSGVLQWQRTITPYTKNIQLDSTEKYMLIVGTYNNGLFHAKLPVDGSKTGTYVVDGNTFVYAAGSGTDSVASTSLGSGNLTIGTGSGTDATLTFTDSSTTITGVVVGV